MNDKLTPVEPIERDYKVGTVVYSTNENRNHFFRHTIEDVRVVEELYGDTLFLYRISGNETMWHTKAELDENFYIEL